MHHANNGKLLLSADGAAADWQTNLLFVLGSLIRVHVDVCEHVNFVRVVRRATQHNALWCGGVGAWGACAATGTSRTFHRHWQARRSTTGGWSD